MIKNALNIQQRLMRHTEYNESSGCWEWFGSKRNGYGRMIIGSRTDDMNQEYFFTVPDGYELFCDFPEILEKTKDKFKKLNETREIAELKEKLRKLEEHNA